MTLLTEIPITTIIFGILLAIFCGALYHLIRGGSSNRLAVNLLISIAGFWLGDYFATFIDWSFFEIGLLNAGIGVIFSLIFLIMVDVITSSINKKDENEK